MHIRFIVENDLVEDACSVWRLESHGEFGYSDGAGSEQYLRDVFRNAKDLGSSSAELEACIKDWPSEYHLSAKRAQHYPDDGSVTLIAPALVVTDPDRPRLSVSADKGSIAGDRETLALEGNVRALREATPGKGGKGEGPATLTTDFLRVVPKKGLAETDRPVTIEEPRGIIHSTGLKLDNEAKTLKLISGVHGTIQPDTLPTK